MKLPPNERMSVADSLLKSLNSEKDSELSSEWKIEIDRRLNDLEAHPERGTTWGELKKTLRPKRRRRSA